VSLTVAKPCPIPNIDFTAVSLGAEPPLWYAAYTLPRHEKAVAEQLGPRHIETYLPLYLSVRRWAQRRALVVLVDPSVGSAPASLGRSFCWLLQRVDAGLGGLSVLVGLDAGDADGADDLAVDDDRDAALEHAEAGAQKPEVDAPCAMASWRAFVGRRSATAERAFSLAMSTLPHCVLSRRCIMTS